MQELTKVEQKILAYIYGYESDNGFVPSLGQIGEDLDFTKQMAGQYINRLIKKGKLKKILEYRSYSTIDKVKNVR